MNRPLSNKELEDELDRLSDMDVDPFHASDDSDPDFECSDVSIFSEEHRTDSVDDSDVSMDEHLESGIENGNNNNNKNNNNSSLLFTDSTPTAKFIWHGDLHNFVPKMGIPLEEKPIIMAKLNRGSTKLDCFYELFTKSLIMQISYYTNLRLQKIKNSKPTSPGEIKIILGCSLIMSYNRVPAMHMYWSRNKSLRNAAIAESIARDRFMLLMSKLYFNEPEKPADASKTYYIEDVLSCMKKTFLKARTDSTFQSIDESMTKFKGRSSLKQYLPLKPVKRGIKLWTRCDAVTGYVYDINIYSGRETEVTEGTLGERVVLKLAETITSSNVALCFDRFFTSTRLLDTIKFAAVGTFIQNRKNTPKFQTKLKERGECEIAVCDEGILAIKWKDTKDVLLMSNCHNATIHTTVRKMKDGTTKDIECPEAMVFYNKYMGGVDLADQMITLYDLDRRSSKWWKKVFFRLLMTSIHNAYILYQELTHKKIPFIDFLVDVAEELISQGRSESSYKRSRRQGRASNNVKGLVYVGDHLPVEKGGRNRCVRCQSRKIEKRTKLICQKCQVALCISCFTPFHT